MKGKRRIVGFNKELRSLRNLTYKSSSYILWNRVMEGSRLIILLGVAFCGVFLLLIPSQYLYLSALIYVALLFDLLIWFVTEKYKYAIVFALAILPLIALAVIVSQYWSGVSILIMMLAMFVAVGWILRWHSKNIAYECSESGYVFSTSVTKLVSTIHMADTRLLKCPQCGYRDWFKAKKIVSSTRPRVP